MTVALWFRDNLVELLPAILGVFVALTGFCLALDVLAIGVRKAINQLKLLIEST